MLTCNVVRDLLPSYIDELVSKETAREIAEHLADCAACNAEYEQMTAPLVPIAIKDQKDIDYLKTIKQKNIRKVLRYSALSVFLVSLIFVFCVQLFYIGNPVKSEDLSYSVYKPNAYSLKIEMELKTNNPLLVKTKYKVIYSEESKSGTDVILDLRQVRRLPFDDVGNSFSWGSEIFDGEIPDNFRVIIKFADKDVVLVADDFKVGSSLDGTWERSGESQNELNADSPGYRVISQSLFFSGESLTITSMIDYRHEEIVSLSDEELKERFFEIDIIERGDDYVIARTTGKSTFSLTQDETRIVIEGVEHIAQFSRLSKNAISLDGVVFLRKN